MFAKRNLEIIRLQDELQRNMQICIDLQEARQEARGEDADIQDVGGAAMFKFANPIPRFSSTRSRLEIDLNELKNKYSKLESAPSAEYKSVSKKNVNVDIQDADEGYKGDLNELIAVQNKYLNCNGRYDFIDQTCNTRASIGVVHCYLNIG